MTNVGAGRVEGLQNERVAVDRPTFIDWDRVEPQSLSPGVRIRTPYGQNIMLSLVEIDAGWVVPMHNHPHEQAGMVLEGRMRFTIGQDSRILEPGQSYIVPPNVQHSAEAVGGRVRALDVFSPIRQDYAQRSNAYIERAAPAPHDF